MNKSQMGEQIIWLDRTLKELEAENVRLRVLLQRTLPELKWAEKAAESEWNAPLDDTQIVDDVEAELGREAHNHYQPQIDTLIAENNQLRATLTTIGGDPASHNLCETSKKALREMLYQIRADLDQEHSAHAEDKKLGTVVPRCAPGTHKMGKQEDGGIACDVCGIADYQLAALEDVK